MDQMYWMVVANGSCMKLFKFEENHRELSHPLITLHPESTLFQKDFDTDKHGSSAGGHDADPVSSKKLEEQKFAREICAFLKEGHMNKEFTRLYLAASPAFLGLIRDYLPKDVQGCIAEETNKDLTKLGHQEIWSHFPSQK